jgi:hypothetical protein
MFGQSNRDALLWQPDKIDRSYPSVRLDQSRQRRKKRSGLVVRDMVKQCGDVYQIKLFFLWLQINGSISNDEALAVTVPPSGVGDVLLIKVDAGVIERRKIGQYVGRSASNVQHLHAGRGLQDFIDVSRNGPVRSKQKHQSFVDRRYRDQSVSARNPLRHLSIPYCRKFRIRRSPASR